MAMSCRRKGCRMMMRMARTRRSGGANGVLGARGNLGQQNQGAHGFEFETCFHVASCNMQVFGIIERLHVGMPHSLTIVLCTMSRVGTRMMRTQMPSGLTDWMSCSGGSSILCINIYIYICTYICKYIYIHIHMYINVILWLASLWQSSRKSENSSGRKLSEAAVSQDKKSLQREIRMKTSSARPVSACQFTVCSDFFSLKHCKHRICAPSVLSANHIFDCVMSWICFNRSNWARQPREHWRLQLWHICQPSRMHIKIHGSCQSIITASISAECCIGMGHLCRVGATEAQRDQATCSVDLQHLERLGEICDGGCRVRHA